MLTKRDVVPGLISIIIIPDYPLQVAIGIENYYTSLNQRAQEYPDQQKQPKNGQ